MSDDPKLKRIGELLVVRHWLDGLDWDEVNMTETSLLHPYLVSVVNHEMAQLVELDRDA